MEGLIVFKPNLLPPQVKRRRRQRLFLSIIRVTLIAAWTLLLLDSLWLYYQYTLLRDIVSGKERTLAELTEQLKKENPLKLYEEAESFIKEVKAFTAELLPLYEFLLPLSANFPQGLRLEKIESLGGGEIKIYGFTSSPSVLGELLNLIKGIEVVRSVSLPGLGEEKNGETPFTFVCKLKEWW